MRQSLKYTWKNLSRSVLFLAPVGILFLMAVLIPASVAASFSLIGVVTKGLLVNMVSFPGMAFLAYEFSGRLIENREKEALYAEQGTRRKLQLSLTLFLLLVLVLYCFLQFLVFSIRSLVFGIQEGYYFGHLAKAVILYGFMPGLIGVGCGYWLSNDRNGRSYVLILIFTILFSPIMNDLLPNSFFGVLKIDEWVRISVPNWWILSNSSFIDPLYGVPIETTRWILSLFWLGVFCSLWLLGRKQKKTVFGTIGFIVVLGITVCCALRFSSREQDSRLVCEQSGIPGKGIEFEDQFFYEDWQKQTMTQDPNVSVSSYTIDLTIKDCLTGTASLKLIEPVEAGRTMLFTLYHGLKVHAVTDEKGKTIPFIQDGDWLDITADHSVCMLTIAYKGRFAKYYTNYQAVLLPAYVAYYPIPGHLTLWEGELNTIVPVGNQPHRQFTVHVNSSVPIACSLPIIGKQEYSGVSDGVTLIGGFWEESESDGLTLYTPLLEKSDLSLNKEEIRQNLLMLTQKLKAKNESAIEEMTKVFMLPTIIRVISGKQEQCVVSANHFTYVPLYGSKIDYSIIAKGIMQSQFKLDSQTALLYDWFQKYLTFPLPADGRLCEYADLEPLIAAAHGESVPAKDITQAQKALKSLFYYRLYQLKEEVFLPLVYEYLTDENRTLHPAEFLYQMKGEP